MSNRRMNMRSSASAEIPMISELIVQTVSLENRIKLLSDSRVQEPERIPQRQVGCLLCSGTVRLVLYRAGLPQISQHNSPPSFLLRNTDTYQLQNTNTTCRFEEVDDVKQTDEYEVIGKCEVDENGEIIKLEREYFRQGFASNFFLIAGYSQ